MKTKGFIICFLLCIIYMACDDTIGKVGLGIQPDEDIVNVFDTVVFVEARTVEVDSVYAKTVSGFLGELYDPSFGVIKSGYMCQYYPSIGFPYLDSIVDNKIDSVILTIGYYSFFGDSLAPMEVTVYPVVKPLDNHYYTNTDPKDFCDLDRPMAKYGYTVRNLTLSDEELKENNYYSISIPLPVKLGQDYLNKVLNDEIKTTKDFLDFFPGTYLTTTFGTGSMIVVDRTSIVLYYKRNVRLSDVNGNDSIAFRISNAAFAVTKEIIQLNKIENKNPDFLYENNQDKSFIKSPAGVFTELTIPIKEIMKGIGKKKFSSIKLSLKAFPRDDWKYSLLFPGMTNSPVPVQEGGESGYSSKLLLIEPDSLATFFETKQIANFQTSFTTQFNSANYTYDFNNIANVVQNAIEKAPEKDLKLLLIPVLTTWVSNMDPYTGNTVKMDYMTSHYLYPSGVSLMKGGDNLKIRVVATDMKSNE